MASNAAASSIPTGDSRVLAPAAAGESVIGARRWGSLAIGSLVIAGLLSLSVVVGRLPFLSGFIDDPLFFRRCLVVHVNLALVVWFYAFLATWFSTQRLSRPGPVDTAAFGISVAGVVTMLAGAFARGAEPLLNNYIPVIDHPVFKAGLALLAGGLLLKLGCQLMSPPARRMPADAFVGLESAAILVLLAGATWISALAGLPPGLDAATRAEFLAWGPGHVLQAANAAAMLAAWLWLLQRATGRQVLTPAGARRLFALLVVPQAVMPLLTVRGTVDTLYYTGATQLMRWSIFPAVLVAFAAGVRHLLRHGGAGAARPDSVRLARAAFAGSAALAALGIVLGAAIRSSTTLVPAHYHASLGAVTLAFMTVWHFLGADAGALAGRWQAARRQVTLFGCGQTVFVLGFAIGGMYGLGRKTYGAEQVAHGAGRILGLSVMGIGGLVAVAAGIWFLALALRDLRAWWARPAPTTPSLRAGLGALSP